MPIFGQLVIGPPGSGKTTYIRNMKDYYETFKRSITTINLDPANFLQKADLFDIDIRDLISLEDVSNNIKLGPNASIMFIFDFLKENIEWLLSKINNKSSYYLIDTPGQTELFCLSNSFKHVLELLKTKLDLRLCVVNLVESNNISDITNYVFSSFSVLNTMIQLELPQINVLSKIDLLKEYSYSNKSLSLELIKQPDVDVITELLNNDVNDKRLLKLNRLISEFISDYSLVGFTILDINNKKHINKISFLVDRANGYIVDSEGGLLSEENIDIRNVFAKSEYNNEVQENIEDDEMYLS